MANNLVTYIMQMLTPDLIGRVAGALGLDSAKVQSAVSAAVPALLAALGGVATQPGGAEKISDAVGQQSASLGELAGMLTSGNQASLAQSGSTLLSSLFGSGNSGVLANAVGSFAGLDKTTGSSLIGMLTPLVLGGLAEQSEGDLSPGNLSGLLASQKDNIAAALPSGIGDMLAGTGLLGSLGGSMRSATAAAGQTAARTTATVSSISNAGQRAAADAASNSYRWLYWLIAALAILAILYFVLGRRAEQPTAPATTTPAATTPAAQETTTAAADVGKQLSDTLTSLQTTVTGITDAATANAALPKLQAAEGEIGKLQATIGALSAEQKTALVTTVKPLVATLNGLLDKVLAIPGVSEVLKPTVDSLKTKLAALAA
jgi:hypothetical protein